MKHQSDSSHFSAERRSFLKGGAALSGAALAANAVQIPIAKANPKPTASTANEKLVWSACTVNCHSRCPLRMHVQDGVIKYVETDNLGLDNYDDFHQVRACARGRSNGKNARMGRKNHRYSKRAYYQPCTRNCDHKTGLYLSRLGTHNVMLTANKPPVLSQC